MSVNSGEFRPKSHFEMEAYFDHEIDHLDDLDIDDDDDHISKSPSTAAPGPEL